jgi:hypothetical protein
MPLDHDSLQAQPATLDAKIDCFDVRGFIEDGPDVSLPPLGPPEVRDWILAQPALDLARPD